MNVKGKALLVTGAGSGIGRELTLGLLARGAKVFAVDVRDESLAALKKESGAKDDQLATAVCDITDRKAVEALPAKVKSSIGELDGIINNAGIIQPFVRVAELDYDAIDRVMNVNFWGTIYMVKTFLPTLSKRPEAHLANVSSMGGFLPVPGQAVYGASKAAVKLLTEALYAEFKDTNVHVSVIFPGAINTNITTNSGVKGPEMPKGEKAKSIPMTQASVAAKTIIDGIEKNKAQIFIGKDSKMMNLLYRINPVFATNLIARQMKSLLDK